MLERIDRLSECGMRRDRHGVTKIAHSSTSRATVAPRIELGQRALRELLGVLGFGLFGYAVFTYDEATPFPGTFALWPVAGPA